MLFLGSNPHFKEKEEQNIWKSFPYIISLRGPEKSFKKSANTVTKLNFPHSFIYNFRSFFVNSFNNMMLLLLLALWYHKNLRKNQGFLSSAGSGFFTKVGSESSFSRMSDPGTTYPDPPHWIFKATHKIKHLF